MTESEAYEVARSVFRSHRVKRHWHIPVIGFGPGTLQLSSLLATAAERIIHRGRPLREGDLALVDIAPEIDGVSSDYSATRVFGQNEAAVALRSFAIDVSRRAARELRATMKVSEAFDLVKNLVETSGRGYRLLCPPLIAAGHRIANLPPSWPYVPEMSTLTYLLLRTPGPFLSSRNSSSMEGLWTLEPYVGAEGMAARHEELLLITRERTLFLGPPEESAA